MRYRVLPYRQGSKGAKALAEALGGKVLKLEQSLFKPKHDDVIINWGNTQPTSEVFPAFYGGNDPRYLNHPQIIKIASNKRLFFQGMKAAGHESIIPRFWTNPSDIPADAYPIVCRTVLAGHSGAGIVIADGVADLVPAPLYVSYVKKKDEYRIHVGRRYFAEDNEVPQYEFPIIAVQKKARRHDTPDSQVNWQVRNHHNGFIYKREGVTPPDCVISAARLALESTGLDFGAVDVIYNSQSGKAYVLEVNTAPGLEGQTIQDYADFFKTQ